MFTRSLGGVMTALAGTAISARATKKKAMLARTKTIAMLALMLVTGTTALADVVASYVFINNTDIDANDFHVTFNKNIKPLDQNPPNNSNTIQNKDGVKKGTFKETKNPKDAANEPILKQVDYTKPRDVRGTRTVAVSHSTQDQVGITLTFGGSKKGKVDLENSYFTFDGERIAGALKVVDATTSTFRQDSAGAVALNFTVEPGSPTVFLSNIRVWTALTEEQMNDFTALSAGAATHLNWTQGVTPGAPAIFPLGRLDGTLNGVVKYDLTYYDSSISADRTVTEVVYGAQVPAPGPVALLALAVGLFSVRRRARAADASAPRGS